MVLALKLKTAGARLQAPIVGCTFLEWVIVTEDLTNKVIV